ncbi:hypothetical protein [Alteribacter aurantiacus]|uniref:hypothetical protein n=1 Tax=Alteribacter aurantiacus TaxID=254410 RepID=UPI00047E918D|nr:hypothetical protein [Alteribacter aurantiacus]
MDKKELKTLRMKQLLFVNGTLLLWFTFFFGLIFMFDVSTRIFFIVIAVILAVDGLFTITGKKKVAGMGGWVPSMKKIIAYEREKMGDEWRKSSKNNGIWSIVLSGLMLFQAWMARSGDTFSFALDRTNIIFFSSLVLVLLLVINGTTLYHNWKVDRSDSQEDFKGYTKKMNLIGIGIGVLVGYVLIIVIINLVAPL